MSGRSDPSLPIRLGFTQAPPGARWRSAALFVDASWCRDTRAGGWAAWIASHGATHTTGASFRTEHASSVEAETEALVNGLWIVALRWPGADVVAWSDCLPALRVFGGTRPPRGLSASSIAMRERAIGVAIGARLSVELRHVRAHRGSADPYSAANSWCDAEAKRHMRHHRAALLGRPIAA